MNTRETLFRLAGNDATKQEAAEQWAYLLEDTGYECIELKTEAQARVLLQHSAEDIADRLSIIVLLRYAISLTEPMFLDNCIKFICSEPGMDILSIVACTFDVLTVEGQRTLLKSLDNLYNYVDIAYKAFKYRLGIAWYELCSDIKHIDNEYRAAWYIAYGQYDIAFIDGAWSLKKLKSILKRPETIDRYAMVEHIDYDYTTEVARYIRTVLDMSGLDYHLFATSEELAEEGAKMHNCIASYWNKHLQAKHGFVTFVLSVEYNGRHIDIELYVEKTEDDFVAYKIGIEQINLAFNKALNTVDYKYIAVTITAAADELYNNMEHDYYNKAVDNDYNNNTLTCKTSSYGYATQPNSGIELYDELGERVATGTMFSMLYTNTQYIYTTTKTMLRVIKHTDYTIEVIDVTGTMEGDVVADNYHFEHLDSELND